MYEMFPAQQGRVFFVKIKEGTSPHQAIESFLADNGITFAYIAGIGAFHWARISVFSPEENKYYPIDVEAEPGKVLEALSVKGNSILGPDGAYYTHLHVALAKKPDQVVGGHLIDGRVRPFLELIIFELGGNIDDARRLFRHRWGEK